MTQSILPAFSTGVISPELVSSTELEKQRYALAESNNMIIDALGGVKNRPGTQYIADAYDTTIQSRLIPFQFNTEQAYMLEFSNLKFRILKDGGLVGAPTVVTTQYTTAEIPDLNFTQSADTLYIFHPDHIIGIIRRISDTVWTFNTPVPFVRPNPYKAHISGNENTTINATYSSSEIIGDYYDVKASTDIFVNALAGDNLRLGFQVPGDLTAIHWHDFQVISKTADDEVVANSGIIEDFDPITYQQVLNPEFVNGLTYWQELSDIADVGSVSYEITTQTAVLTDPVGAGTAIIEQSLTTLSLAKHMIKVVTSGYTGATPTLTLNIGTTSKASDILTQVLATGTTYRFFVLPTTETIFISFDTVGSTDGDVTEIDEVKLYRADQASGAGTEINTSEWRTVVWNATLGYPAVGIYDGQRLYVGNTASQPQTIWASQLGGFTSGIPIFRFNTPTQETDSFSFSPATAQRNGVDWITESNGLKVGTSAAIWNIFATTGGAITPTDVNIKVDSAVGTLALNPISSGDSILLAPRGMAAVSEITSSFERSGFVPRDVTILARHLFEDRRIVRWAFAKNPDSVVWCVLDDGTLLSFTYVREYDVWAWSKHTTPLGEGFKDVAVIPNSSDDNIDDVYFVINRAEVGVTANYYIEQLNKRITSQTAAFGLSASGTPYDYKFLDSALTVAPAKTITGATKATPVVITSTAHGYSDGDLVRIQNVVGMTELNNNVYKVANKNPNDYELNDTSDNAIDGTAFTTYLSGGESRKMVTALSGLDHLEGETVTALADGAVMPNLTVTSGAITLPTAASYAHVGIPYVSDIETIDLEVSGDQGSTQGRLKSATKATVYFKETRGAEFQTASATDNTWWPMSFDSEEFGENPLDLLTGTKEISLSANYREQERLKIRQTEPLPIHIKRIIPDVDYSG